MGRGECRERGRRGRREPGGRPESAPTARRLGRRLGARAAVEREPETGTWFCGCCAASRLMRSREKSVWELYRLEAWQARALAGLELGLKAQAGEPLAAELDAAKRHIGELSMGD